MNGNEGGKKAAGSSQAGSKAALRAVVGAYLIYLGVSLVRDFLGGGSTMTPWAAWGFGIFFVLAGGGVLWYTWRRWRAETAEQTKERSEEARSED